MPDPALLGRRPRASSSRAWWAVVAMFLLNGALFGAWASRIPEITARFALDAGELGLVLLALAAGAIASFPIAGALSERVGAAGLTRAIAVCYAPALVLIAMAPNVPALVIAVFVFGAAFGSMDVAMNGWAAEVERSLSMPLMSGFHAMFSLGAGLGAASGYAAVRVDADVLAHFVAIALLLAPAALVVARIPWRPDGPAEPDAAAHPLLALPRGPLVAVGLVAFGISLGEGAMADWSALFLVEVAGADAGTAALGYAAFNTSMVIVRLAGDRIVTRLGPVPTARGSAVLAALGVLLAVSGASTGWSLAGFALMGAGYAIVMPLAFSRAANDDRLAPGPAIASVATLGYGGMLLGPPLVGFVAELAGLRAAFAILGVLALMSAALAGALSLRRREAA